MNSPDRKIPRTRGNALQGDSPVYSFLENPSMIDYPGRLCAVFFISGCNFACGFCHNAALMAKKQACISWSRLDEVCRRFQSSWADAVCITGGEPTLSGGLDRLIGFFRSFGFRIKLDTNGSRPDVLQRCLPQIDFVSMDIKAGLSGYPDLTGFKETGRIRESAALLMESGKEYEFRTTIIDPFHSDEQMLEIAHFIEGAKRYCIQPFIPQDHLPDPVLRKTKRTAPERLVEIERLMRPFVQEIRVRGS